jgi:hypothetical protein
MSIAGLRGMGFWVPNENTPFSKITGFPNDINSFEIAKEVTSNDETGWPIGSEDAAQQILRKLQNLSTWTLTVQFVNLNWSIFELVAGFFESSSSTYLERESFSGIVPDTAPYETVDSRITAAATTSNMTISKTKRSDVWGEKGDLTIVETAPADATEAELDVAGTKIVWHSTQAGMPFNITLPVSRSNIKTINVESGQLPFNELAFTGIIATDSDNTKSGIRVNVPSMQTDGNVTFAIGDGIPAYSATFTMVTAPGKLAPIEFALRL